MCASVERLGLTRSSSELAQSRGLATEAEERLEWDQGHCHQTEMRQWKIEARLVSSEPRKATAQLLGGGRKVAYQALATGFVCYARHCSELFVQMVLLESMFSSLLWPAHQKGEHLNLVAFTDYCPRSEAMWAFAEREADRRRLKLAVFDSSSQLTSSRPQSATQRKQQLSTFQTPARLCQD